MYDGDGDPVPLVQNASYNAAGQLTSLRRLSQPAYTTGWIQWTSNVVDTDTFSYNVLGQLIRQSSTGYSWSPDIQYNYSATANDGRILQRVDAYRAGVGMPAGPTATTNYQYDTLGRITSAVPSSSTTALNWGQSYVFDPFGNLLQKNVTQGSATAMNLTIDPATNRISAAGFAYDAAGNLTQMPTANGSQSYVYDSENRISQTVSGQPIFYGINGERIYDGDSWHYYGPGGAHMGSVRVSSPSFLDDVQFAGRPVYQKNSAVETDRLGSVVQKSVDDGVFNYTYLPYGESVALPRPAQNMPFCWPNCASSQDPIPFVAFGTYLRDGTFDPAGTGLHRYYDPARGRFTTADPAQDPDALSNPSGWNRYAYVRGDPVNFGDPRGLWTTSTIHMSPLPCPPGSFDLAGCSDGSGGGWWDDWGWGYGGWLGGPGFGGGPSYYYGGGGGGGGAWTPPRNCGQAVSSSMPSGEEGRDEIAVVLGENSWYKYRWNKDGVTASDVGTEDAYMIATMRNLARAYDRSVEWTIKNGQYKGYRTGWQLLNDALDELVDSSDCQDLIGAIAGYNAARTLKIPYTQWRKVGAVHPGGIVIAGTVFFSPLPRPKRRHP